MNDSTPKKPQPPSGSPSDPPDTPDGGYSTAPPDDGDQPSPGPGGPSDGEPQQPGYGERPGGGQQSPPYGSGGQQGYGPGGQQQYPSGGQPAPGGPAQGGGGSGRLPHTQQPPAGRPQRPPSYGGRPQGSPQYPGGQRPPKYGTGQPSQQPTPYGPGDPSQTPPYGGQQQPPYGGGQQQPPYGGGQPQPPYGGSQPKPPYGDAGQPKPPYGGGGQQPPYGGGGQHPPYGGGGQQPPYGGGGQQPPHGPGGQQPYDPGMPQPQPYGEEEPPPKPGCPDPCDTPPPWGPPEIPAECCPDPSDCCPQETATRCAWDDIEDPCVRATSAACGVEWTRLTCRCESANPACDCSEWECGSGDATCVPCRPCEGLIPGDDPGEYPPPPDGCDADQLRVQLELLRKRISSQLGEKARIDADIKARQEREKELTALIASYEGILDKYKNERHKLVSRENALKGFARDIADEFADQNRFPLECLDELQQAINSELCGLEKVRCCQKNLEGKLETPTRLVRERQAAETAWKKAEEAVKAVKDLPKYISDQFAQLEALKDQIALTLNDKDPKKHKWAFYLFYWKFLPGLCRRFRVAICCGRTDGSTGEAAAPMPHEAWPHLGCRPGDWHPTHIDERALEMLICCAWDEVRRRKEIYQEKSDAVDAARHNLEFIKKLADDSAKTLEDRIKLRIDKVTCTAGPAAS